MVFNCFKLEQDENRSLQIIKSGACTHSHCFSEAEWQEGAHSHSWQLSPPRGSGNRSLYMVCFLSHCYAPSQHLCPLICPVKPFLSTSRVLFELLALGHSPMPLCWVHIHEIHIALGKGEGLGKLQEILSYIFSCLSFLITFSQYKLQSV